MKSGRRTDSESLRRDSRDPSHGVGRVRKRPTMLSEFHGKHYNHRDGPDSHYRSHSRHSYDGAAGGLSSDHDRPSHCPSNVYKSSKGEFRSRYSHSSSSSSHHHNYRSSSSHHHHSSGGSHGYHNDSGDHMYDDEVPVKKRPRLTVDVSRKASTQFDAPNSADSVISSSNFTTGSATPSLANESPADSPQQGTGGLSAYHLEDIDSDDDTLLQNDEDDHLSSSAKSPPAPSDSTSLTKPTTNAEVPHERKSSISAPVVAAAKSPPRPSKEELLQMMEKVDRDIAAVETQISTLQKKKIELEESARSASGITTPTPPTISTPSPPTPSHDVMEDEAERDTTPVPSPVSPVERRAQQKRSLMETIYSENKAKARLSQNWLHSVYLPSLQLHMVKPLYHQPSEAPLYHHNILSHKSFRPKLLDFVRRRKVAKAKAELALCEEYDSQMAEWERKVDKTETSSKKRTKDFKNRELFEKVFPELKAKREQQERFTRVDQRGFGVVRSDAELSELAYELFEQEEASVRFRKTHATIPPMLIDNKEREMRFYNNNSLIPDPMALHRQAKFSNIWTDEEKAIFRDKYTLYSKNFEMIASFLPNKSTSECVKYYYISKKSENFKQLARKANFKRKKAFVKSTDMLSLNHSLSTPHHPMLLDSKPETVEPPSEYGDWDEDEIECLKEGLRKFGRAWGKIYREVGGRKTATQCKQFYDTHCTIEKLGLLKALADHSSMKNAEKLQRKAESRKNAAAVAAEEAAKKKKAQKQRPKPTQLLVESISARSSGDVDSENTESASETETNSEDSASESTITDSGEEGAPPSSTIVSAPQTKGNARSAKRANRTSTSSYRTEEAVGLFISAAEALDNMIPLDVALHDHNYALPPDALINNMDLQGSSGLSLIAAAAAVVSPSFPRSGGKSPVLSPIRAPRGRPPNTQRRSGSNSTSKLLPNFLSPAGSSSSVLLTDIKSATFRSRTRSAPTDRPKSAMLHIPRPGSSLTKSSFIPGSGGSGGGTGSTSNGGGSSRFSTGRGGSGVLHHSYSRQRSDMGSSSPSSLKSVVSLKPQQTGTSAFEALVNVAVAAPPAELPRTTGAAYPSKYSSSSHSRSSSSHSHHPSTKGASKSGAALSTLINAHHHNSSPSSLSHKDGSATSAGGGKTTAYIDVGQAITILASLAQQASNSTNTSTASISVQPFIGHASSSLIGSLVSQVSNSRQGGGASSGKGASSSVETLIGHLTSGVASNGSKSDVSKKSTPSGSSKRTYPASKSDPSMATLSISQGPPVNNSNSNSSNSATKGDHKKTAASHQAGGTPHTIQITASMDDLSNLNLLSSLVAAVAASQATNPHGTGSNSNPSASSGSHSNTHQQPTSLSYNTGVNAATAGSRSNATLQLEFGKGSSSSARHRDSREMMDTSPSGSDSPSIPSHAHISSDVSSAGFPSNYSLENDVSKREVERSTRDSYSPQVVNCKDGRSMSKERDSARSTQPPSSSSYKSDETDDLPRSVVRTSLTARVRESSNCESKDTTETRDTFNANSLLDHPPTTSKANSTHLQSSSTHLQSSQHSSDPPASDMTASLASIIPPFNPSTSQQSSLLLYTHSLSFPLSTTAELSNDEEDHLESATRGISELSKLLGTDTGADSQSSLNWNPADLLSPPPTTFPSAKTFPSKATSGEFGNSTSNDSLSTSKPVFSGLLESQIHGTIHHSPVLVNSTVKKSTAAVGSTATTAGLTNEGAMDLEHHSR